MPNRFPSAYACTSLFVLGLLSSPAPAFAGFQWVAPPEAPATAGIMPSAPMAPAPSVATNAPEVISPVIISGNANLPPPTTQIVPRPSYAPSATYTVSPAPVAPAPTVGGAVVMPAPTTMTTLSVAPSVVQQPVAPAPTEVVHGFAKQVPLAVALRQILPAGYGFSVDPDVDLGVLISFQGGKPWRDTLRDALEPAGLVLREQGQMVSIGRPPVIPMTDVVSSVAVPVTTRNISVVSNAPTPVIETMPQSDQWTGERGETLHKIIENWTKRSNIELNWLAEYDYPLQASFAYTGTFEEAVRNLLMGFEDAHPQPVAELHTNPGLGLRVLLVQTRGNTNGN